MKQIGACTAILSVEKAVLRCTAILGVHETLAATHLLIPGRKWINCASMQESLDEDRNEPFLPL